MKRLTLRSKVCVPDLRDWYPGFGEEAFQPPSSPTDRITNSLSNRGRLWEFSSERFPNICFVGTDGGWKASAPGGDHVDIDFLILRRGGFPASFFSDRLIWIPAGEEPNSPTLFVENLR